MLVAMAITTLSLPFLPRLYWQDGVAGIAMKFDEHDDVMMPSPAEPLPSDMAL